MHDNISSIAFDSFCDAARIALRRESDGLLSETLPALKSSQCTWHPNGFAVFHINDHHELGKLRLHIWPSSGRVGRAEAPPIHSHVWHLCSQILAGTYSETLYEESRSGSEQAATYHSADIDYLVNRDAFEPAESTHLRPTSKLTVTAGEFHTVQAGVPHETVIGENSFVATLLLTSAPQLTHASVYAPKQISVSSYDRPILNDAEKFLLLDRLYVNLGELS